MVSIWRLKFVDLPLFFFRWGFAEVLVCFCFLLQSAASQLVWSPFWLARFWWRTIRSSTSEIRIRQIDSQMFIIPSIWQGPYLTKRILFPDLFGLRSQGAVLLRQSLHIISLFDVVDSVPWSAYFIFVNIKDILIFSFQIIWMIDLVITGTSWVVGIAVIETQIDFGHDLTIVFQSGFVLTVVIRLWWIHLSIEHLNMFMGPHREFAGPFHFRVPIVILIHSTTVCARIMPTIDTTIKAVVLLQQPACLIRRIRVLLLQLHALCPQTRHAICLVSSNYDSVIYLIHRILLWWTCNYFLGILLVSHFIFLKYYDWLFNFE